MMEKRSSFLLVLNVVVRKIYRHFVDYRFVNLRFVYKLNTKTSDSWLTKPKTLKLNAKTGLAISNWSAKIIDESRVDESIVNEPKTSHQKMIDQALPTLWYWQGSSVPFLCQEFAILRWRKEITAEGMGNGLRRIKVFSICVWWSKMAVSAEVNHCNVSNSLNYYFFCFYTGKTSWSFPLNVSSKTALVQTE